MAHISKSEFKHIFNKLTYGFTHPDLYSYLSKYIAHFCSIACHDLSELVTVF